MTTIQIVSLVVLIYLAGLWPTWKFFGQVTKVFPKGLAFNLKTTNTIVWPAGWIVFFTGFILGAMRSKMFQRGVEEYEEYTGKLRPEPPPYLPDSDHVRRMVQSSEETMALIKALKEAPPYPISIFPAVEGSCMRAAQLSGGKHSLMPDGSCFVCGFRRE